MIPRYRIQFLGKALYIRQFWHEDCTKYLMDRAPEPVERVKTES